MNSFLPLIGKHKIDRIYTMFERPSLFTIRNEFDTLYLVSIAEETKEGEIILAVPISSKTKMDLEQGDITLRSVFTESSIGVIKYFIPFYTLPEDASCSNIPKKDIGILNEYLPLEGYKLICDTQYLHVGLETTSLPEAITEWKEIYKTPEVKFERATKKRLAGDSHRDPLFIDVTKQGYTSFGEMYTSRSANA